MSDLSLSFLERFPKVPTPNPPVLILIHGRAAEAKTIFSIEGLLDPAYHVLAITAPYDSALGGREWFHPPEPMPGEVHDAKQFEESERILTGDVEAHLVRLNIDKSRAFLWGFSQGAAMALILGLRGTIKPSGVIPMCGFLPTGVKHWQTWDISPRFLFVHATEDEVLPTESSKKAKAFVESKGATAEYHEYKGRHKMTMDSIRFVNEWIKNLASA